MSSPLSQIDANFQTIKALEGASWLPALPQEVTLDLVGSTQMNPSALKQLFLGLQSDLEEASRPQSLPVRTPGPDVWSPIWNEYSRNEELARSVYGTFSEGRPKVYDPDAVVNWKQRAVDRGYLDLTPDEIRSPVWLPEYSGVVAEMLRDKSRQEFSGDRPGLSIGTDGIMDLVTEWLSPRGLYKAAVEMDMWWDFDAIGREAGSWLDKWKLWSEEPWNPARLIDAITGPVDDVVFPIINWALMFTGVSEVFLGVKAASLTGKVAKGIITAEQAAAKMSKAQHVAGLYRGAEGWKAATHFGKYGEKWLIPGAVKGGEYASKGLEGAAWLDDAMRFRNESFLATLMGPGSGQATGRVAGALDKFRETRAVSATHSGMQKWRDLTGVVAAKKVNQQVLRTGFISNVEQAIDQERGLSLATETGLDDAVEALMSNPLVDFAADAFIYPPNIMERGAFVAAARGIKQGVQKATGFENLSFNEHLTAAWHDATAYHLQAEIDRLRQGGDKVLLDNAVRELDEYNKLVDRVGVRQALLQTKFGGDEEFMDGMMAYVTTAAALEASAKGNGYHWEEFVNVTDGMSDSQALRTFHRNRNHLIGQMKHYDVDDIDEYLNGMTNRQWNRSLSDEMPDEVLLAGGKSQRPSKVAERKYALRETMLEPREVTAGRTGAAPGEVRLYGAKDHNGDGIVWQVERPSGPGVSDVDMVDPFYVDVNLAEFNVDEAAVFADPDTFGGRVMNRFRLKSGRQGRLSQVAEVGRFDPAKVQAAKEIMGHHNELRAKFIAEMMSQVSPSMLRQYIFEVMPTTGRWDDYLAASNEVKQRLRTGQLDEARLLTAAGESGSPSALMPNDRDLFEDKWLRELDDLVLRLGNEPELREQLSKSVFSPLLREVAPTRARVTVARSDTPTKGEALGLVATIKTHFSTVRAVQRIERTSKDILPQVDAVLAAGGVSDPMFAALSPSKRVAKMVELVAKDAGLSAKKTEDLKRIVRWAQRNNIPVAQIRAHLDETTQMFLSSNQWGRFGVPEQPPKAVRGKTLTPEGLLEAKMKDLQARTEFIAAEIEAPADLAEELAARGYKLVYGAGFATMDDLTQIVPEFADVTAKRMRKTSWQSWFARKDEANMRAIKTRMVKQQLIKGLRQAKKEGMAVNLNPEDEATVNQLISDLYDALHSYQDDARATLDASQNAGPISKIGARMSLARIPFDLPRFPSDTTPKQFAEFAKNFAGLTDDEVKVVREALLSAQALGFKEHGLFAVESYLRSKNNIYDGLRFFGRHQYFENKYLDRGARLGVSAGSLGAGIQAAAIIGEDDDSMVENISQFAVGALAGRAAGGKLARSRLLPHGASVEGRLAAKWRHRPAGYVVDRLANLRDMVRFSLSPLFDLSRYSEAVILNQVGEVPTVLKNPRFNPSPRGVRYALKQQAKKAGVVDSDSISAFVKQGWDSNRAEFAAAARGDLDVETIDSVARRFSSVGILGFSPMDWMESTFWHLRQADVAPDAAYKIVRDTYTYGTTGRSSAELSMNFVFFPFSFTKKAVTHLGKFFSEDLGRLVVLQDGLEAYQALSDNYDLSNEFRDRLPVVRRLNRMNILAYGIGPGRFGGVNASIYGGLSNLPGVGDAAGSVFDEIGVDDFVGLFLPQVVSLNNERDAEELMALMEDMLPVVNDINTMIEDFFDQTRVLTSGSHLTARAERDRGWEEWRDFQKSVLPYLQRNGETWNSAMARPEFNAYVTQKRAEIGRQYPRWVQDYGDGIADRAALEMEERVRITKPESDVDFLLIDFRTALNRVEEQLQEHGQSFSNPEFVAPSAYDYLHRVALEMVERDPRFLRLYNRFYRRLLGDITKELI